MKTWLAELRFSRGPKCQLKHRQRRKGTHQSISLPNLVGRLLQASLRRIYPAIALVDVLLQVAHVVVLEAVLVLLPLRQPLVFRLEGLGMHLGTLAEILLGVGEEVVRTRAGEIGPADFGVVERELLGARRGGRAHKLLEQLSLFSGHDGGALAGVEGVCDGEEVGGGVGANWADGLEFWYQR